MTSTLFSIGHGTKSPEEFISELLSFGIQYLIDVRSTPYSKWAQQFNQGLIERLLRSYNIIYAYMGDVIGGRPVDDSCYDDEGRFDYQKMASVPQFKAGLERLIIANANHYRVAVMCSESDPSQCHRSKLIGRELYFNHDIDMHHIVAPNKTISEPAIIMQLTNNRWNPQPTLGFFDDKPYFKSRNVRALEPVGFPFEALVTSAGEEGMMLNL